MASKATVNFYARLIHKGQYTESQIPEDIRPIVIARVKELAESDTTSDPLVAKMFAESEDDCGGNCETCSAKNICSKDRK